MEITAITEGSGYYSPLSGTVFGYHTASAGSNESDCASHCSSGDHMGLRENMEEEEGIWMKEIKISLPPYKMICALFFILILAIVRGISSIKEIGPTIDSYITLLTLVLCADTCYQEIPGGGWEILAIKPGKQQRLTILKRFAVQYVFLICTAAAGYGLFYLIQQPYMRENELIILQQQWRQQRRVSSCSEHFRCLFPK